MNALEKLLISRIAQTGPMRVDEYMAECLLHPRHGYYTSRDPLGAQGDFITAPEISQMFGELIGLALAQTWLDQGAPAPFTLAELGPGRGTLMADLLRASRAVPGFHDAMDLVLVEISEPLQARQQAALAQYQPRFVTHVEALPEAPLFVIANEFFDALPVRQFLRAGNGWRERLVGLEGDRLAFGLGAPVPVATLAPRLDDTREGDMVETCAPASALVESLSRRIRNHGGGALIIDYGTAPSLGDTFQALRNHQKVDPLSAPGSADLTAHVDFAALSEAATGLTPHLTSQGAFLERLGIGTRAEALAARLSGKALENHLAAHRRLTHPDEMGTLFKVLGLTPPGVPPIAGTADVA